MLLGSVIIGWKQFVVGYILLLSALWDNCIIWMAILLLVHSYISETLTCKDQTLIVADGNKTNTGYIAARWEVLITHNKSIRPLLWGLVCNHDTWNSPLYTISKVLEQNILYCYSSLFIINVVMLLKQQPMLIMSTFKTIHNHLYV